MTFREDKNMYNEHFGFPESPFNVTPDPRFFFINSCYNEAFATLRYGISARKGFIVVTGEPGTGKTTLLKRLLGNLDRNVHTAWIFDPHLTFNELLRLTLSDLGLPPSPTGDRLAMIGQFYDYLIEQLKRGDIVSLLIDEAQNLDEEMLEELRLLSNLETNTEKLIQIVLVGQPELEEKLDRAGLLQLKQRVAVRCRMRPLQEDEVSSYIDSRLKTVKCERQDLFDAESIAYLAHYSKGIPRLINVICDNALLIAYAKAKRSVTAADIEEAAHELKLVDHAEKTRNPSRPQRNSAEQGEAIHSARSWESSSPSTSAQLSGPKEKRQNERKNGRSQPEFEPFFVDIGWHKPIRAHRSGVSVLMILCLIAGAALFIGMEKQPLLLPIVRAYFAKLSDFGRQEEEPAQPAVPLAETKLENDHDTVSHVTPPSDSSARGPNADEEILPAPETPPPSEAETADRTGNAPAKSSPEIPNNKRMVIKRRPPTPVPIGEALPERKLQIEIYKAIRDRAIDGVQVSYVDDGTVYLEGRVATPRQKLAAVRATLGVPGVKGVRDRIVIDY